MSNILKEGGETLAAIRNRAASFISQCAEAGSRSVDIYVSFVLT